VNEARRDQFVMHGNKRDDSEHKQYSSINMLKVLKVLICLRC
jgi:hypothetical protein